MATLGRRIGLGLAARGEVDEVVDWARLARRTGLDSVWVHEELDMVNQLGLGVLQLAWTVPDPGDPSGIRLLATPGTEFNFQHALEPRHFEDPGKTIGPDATLKAETLK